MRRATLPLSRCSSNPSLSVFSLDGTSVIFYGGARPHGLIRFGTKRVLANRVYQEYISDKSHLHMNATRWVTLSEFVKHLGRSGIARVDETEKGWFIAWIDNSPNALAKAVCLRRSCDSPRLLILCCRKPR